MILRAFLLFVGSVLLTSIFSYSLQPFLKEDFLILTLKTMLIPCFTWTILILLSYKKLSFEKWKEFLLISGLVCIVGSALLVPAGIYNFISDSPLIIVSVISVLSCVVAMSGLYYRLLPTRDLSRYWWRAFNILICINMSLFYLSTKI